MIPLGHDFTDETVLVVGGGSVGARKARQFATEARVVVVSPVFEATLEDEADVRETSAPTAPAGTGPGIELVRAAPTAEEVAAWVDVLEPALVVAATDDEAVNDAAARAARRHGALVNRADVSGGRAAGSVVVPATVEDGPVTVSITTGGASPALSKYLRERLEGELAGVGEMAELTRALRADLKDSDRSPPERRDAVRRVVRSSLVWKALRTGDTNPRRVAERVMHEDTDSDGGDE